MAGQHPDVKHVRQDVTVNANTSAASPSSVTVQLGLVVLERIDVRIPPGHAGLTGIQALYDGDAIIPWKQPAAWFVGEDDRESFPIGFDLSHGVTIRTFNADTKFAHTFYLTFVVRDLLRETSSSMLDDVAPVDVGAG